MAAGSPLLLPAQKQALAADAEAQAAAAALLTAPRLRPAAGPISEVAAARARLDVVRGQLASHAAKGRRLLAKLARAEAAAVAFAAVPDGRRRAGQ